MTAGTKPSTTTERDTGHVSRRIRSAWLFTLTFLRRFSAHLPGFLGPFASLRYSAGSLFASAPCFCAGPGCASRTRNLRLAPLTPFPADDDHLPFYLLDVVFFLLSTFLPFLSFSSSSQLPENFRTSAGGAVFFRTNHCLSFYSSSSFS